MLGMVKYLSQFVLQMLPSIAATVVGAYIVTTYINPRTPPDAAKTAAAQARQAEKATPPATTPSAEDQAAAPQAADAKPAQAVDKAKPVKAATAPADVRIIPIVKPAAAATMPTGEVQAQTPAVEERKEERKDANDLARAAIQRLRNPAETREASRQVEEPARPATSASTVRVPQQARLAPEAPSAPAVIPVSAPPLPPAIDISAPRYPQLEESATTASVGSEDRLTPPAEVPALVRKPLDLRAANAGHNLSVAEDFLSATKSFFRSITP